MTRSDHTQPVTADAAEVLPLGYQGRPPRRPLPPAARWGLVAAAAFVLVVSATWWVDRTRVLEPVPTRPSRLVADFDFSLAPRYTIDGNAQGNLDSRRGQFDREFDYTVRRADEGQVDAASLADAFEAWVARQVAVTGSQAEPVPTGVGVSRTIHYTTAETVGQITVTIAPSANGESARLHGSVDERRR